MPGWFWDVTGWLSLRRDRVRFVIRHLLVRDLRVAPQTEHVNGGPPGADYLARLDGLAAARRLVPQPAGLLYVTRAGLPAQGKGGHAGEGYLVAILHRAAAAGADIRVLDPGCTPLVGQLSLYAGAAQIVFAEGSALHGRQLLGYRAQGIAVLTRRPGLQVARSALSARCDRLTHVAAARRIAMPVRRDGTPMPALALGFYDIPVLLAAFAERGVDLARDWDDAGFVAARDADLRAWTRAVTGPLPARAQIAALAGAFQAEGLGRPQDWRRSGP